MAIRKIKNGSAVVALFEVVDVRQARGFGLHVATGASASGQGEKPEFFLHMKPAVPGGDLHPDDRLCFTYFDGRRRPEPFMPFRFEPVEAGSPAPTVVDPADAGRPALTVAQTLDTDLSASVVLQPVEPLLPLPAIGPDRFDVTLGRRGDIENVKVHLSVKSLDIACRRSSSSTDSEWPREFTTSASIPMNLTDLGAHSPLLASDNGLLDSSGNADSGSGYRVLVAKIFTTWPGSEDDRMGMLPDDLPDSGG